MSSYFPLWQAADGRMSNFRPALLKFLSQNYGQPVNDEDLIAYLAAVTANPAFTQRFQPDLVQPGLRVPLTADADLFRETVRLGRHVIWLHTFGERFTAPAEGRPKGPPRLPKVQAPRIPADGAIPDSPDSMPEIIDYDVAQQRLLIGDGYVERVSQAVWNYEVSGKQILRQWFSYRQKDRERPVMGDRRPPSKLEDIKADHWLAEYTTDLIDLLNVLGLLVQLEPQQAALLERICSGRLFSVTELNEKHSLERPAPRKAMKLARGQRTMLDEED